MKDKHYLKIFIFILFSNFTISPQNISHFDNETEIDENIKFHLEKIINEKQVNREKLKSKKSKKTFFAILGIGSLIAIENIFIWNSASKRNVENDDGLSSKYKKKSATSNYLVDHEGKLNGILLDLSSVNDPSIAYNDSEIKPVIDDFLDSIVFMFNVTEKTENLKNDFNEIREKVALNLGIINSTD